MTWINDRCELVDNLLHAILASTQRAQDEGIKENKERWKKEEEIGL